MFRFRWMKNSSGEPDAMLTCAFVSFVVTSLCVGLSMIESINMNGVDISLKTPSETLLLGYLAACFTSYVVRRNAKLKHEGEMPINLGE